MDYKFYIRETEPNKIVTPGVSHGYGVGNKIDLIHKEKDFMVVRFPGANEFSSRGSSEYYPTRYALVKIIDKYGTFDEYFEIIEEIEPGKRWKKTKDDLVAKCKAMQVERDNGKQEAA